MVDTTTDRSGEHHATSGWRRSLLPLAVWAIVSAAAIVASVTRLGDCRSLAWRGPLAGGEAEWEAAQAACAAAGDAPGRASIAVVLVVVAASMAALAPILRRLWAHSWRARPFRDWQWMWLTAAGAATLGAAAAVALAAGADGLTAVLAWPASMLWILAMVASVFSVLATIGSDGVPTALPEGVPWVPPPVHGLGICVSGGGIRAAAFAMGALALLERRRLDGSEVPPASEDSVLESADYLASVSGGGYTAGAWRIARGEAGGPTTPDPGVWPDGILGDPTLERGHPRPAFDEAAEADAQPAGLFGHCWQRRDFLRTGRGGLALSAALFVVTVLFQLGVLALGVILVAWPLGVVARSWPVLGPEHFDAVPFTFEVTGRALAPAAAAAVLAAALAIARSFMLRTRLRLAVDGTIVVLLGVAVALLGVLAGLPWLVSVMGGNVLASIIALGAAGGGLLVTVGRFLWRMLGARAARMGGVLFAVAALVFAGIVLREAALPGGALRDTVAAGPIELAAPVWYALVAALFLVIWSVGDPRWWSLFPVYRNRLRSAFAATTDPERAGSRRPVSPQLYPLARRHEPTLDLYRGAPGPEHLVCCAAARDHGRGTGIPALSFVFSPSSVAMYEIGTAGAVTVHEVDTPRFVAALGRRTWTRLPARRPRSLGTVSAAVAMSGAAVTSSMGRFNAGSTNALIAGMNVRLGAWVPNPRHVALDARPAKRARVNYLVKELFGWFDLDDPHVYVTDGGHWDNLGLVELLRRRCETIVCIDASGDAPGLFTTLRQALDLALVECRADVDLDTGEHSLATMCDVGGRRPATASALGRITYLDTAGRPEGHGTILFVKAQVCVEHTASLVSYSFEDPLFPDYSTADQFLGADQYLMLARLGWESAAAALPKLQEVAKEA